MPAVLSTKRLLPNQRELLLNAGVSFVEYNAITVSPVHFEIPSDIKNIIITSQNAAREYIKKYQSEPVENIVTMSNTLGQAQNDKTNYFVVGQKTAALLLENGLKVIKIAKNSTELGHLIVKYHKNDRFTYFCSKQRRDELPTTLKDGQVSLDEIVTYEITLNVETFNQQFDGVLFFSPSGVEAFAKANPLSLPLKGEKEGCIAFCIGETTADEARKYTDNIIVSNATRIESTIAKAVNYLKKKI